MSCNGRAWGRRALAVAVSIPIGFSNELQRRVEQTEQVRPPEVSIPIGFSNELQLRLRYER